jgi:hypothetical protein
MLRKTIWNIIWLLIVLYLLIIVIHCDNKTLTIDQVNTLASSMKCQYYSISYFLYEIGVRRSVQCPRQCIQNSFV